MIVTAMKTKMAVFVLAIVRLMLTTLSAEMVLHIKKTIIMQMEDMGNLNREQSKSKNGKRDL